MTRPVRRESLPLRSVGDLFRSLGYPIDLTPISRKVWTEAGIDPALPANVSIFHGVSIGTLDLLFIVGSQPALRETVLSLFRFTHRRNRLRKTVITTVNPTEASFTVHDQSASGRIRRLEVDPTIPDGEAMRRFLQLRLEEPRKPSRDAIESSFDRSLDRDTLAKTFLREFRDAIELLGSELRGPAESDEAVRSQALLILSRILFLHFIQEKGWLAGERRFLDNHLRLIARTNKSIHRELIRPLFFGCLNTPVAARSPEARRLGEIPYLNGGLFELSPFELRNEGSELSNQALGMVFAMFDKFSFCLDENDQDGVHIDPEMLGKVFEALMAADQRAESGSFYTPKEIVEVLARSAIVRWAAGGDRKLGATLEAAARGERFEIARHEAVCLLDRFERITILDPACGSGAFLLSALHIVERVVRKLQEAAGRSATASLRQSIVETSLFGVDLKREAVRLCELRLWLAIVTESSATPATVAPLPNLDRNILQGNALLSPLDFLGAGRGEIHRSWSYALRARKQLTDAFRHALPEERPRLYRALRQGDEELAAALLERSILEDECELALAEAEAPRLFASGRPSPKDPVHAAILRDRIGLTTLHLEKVKAGELDFFSFDVQFGSILAEGGFDVVIGNPPWVRSSRIEPSARRMYRDRYATFRDVSHAEGEKRSFNQSDLAVAFCEKSFDLVKQGGAMSMLVPAKFANARYATALRQKHSRFVAELHDWSDRGTELFAADTFPLGFTLSKTVQSANEVTLSHSLQCRVEVPRAEILRDDEWLLAPRDVCAVVTRLRSEFPRLHEALGRTPVMGVKTGANERFFLHELSIEGSFGVLRGGKIRIPVTHLCRAVRGRDVRRWQSASSCWMLWPPLRGWENPPEWVLRLAAHLDVPPASLRLSFVKPEHLGMKVVWKDLARGLQAVVLPEVIRIGDIDFPLVPNQTTYFVDTVSLDEAYLLSAFLNSTAVNAIAVTSAERAKDFHYRYFGALVRRLPMPLIDSSDPVFGELVRLARRAHVGTEPGPELDRIVNALFRVSEREHATLSRYLADRFGGK